MSRWLASVAVLLIFLALSPAAEAQIPVPDVTISGGDLRFELRLAPVDADAFQRRVNQPPRLKEEPSLAGPSYVVATPYWDEAIRREDDDEEDARMSLDASYYPQGGYVVGQLDGEEVWMVLDLRQRAILDRYIRLANARLINGTPSLLDVLVAAARDEAIGVDIGVRQLTSEEAALFWQAPATRPSLETERPPEWHPPPAGPESIWVLLTLPEGHSIELHYDTLSGTLIDKLGQELYSVPPDWLEPILGPMTPGLPAELTLQIEHQDPTGSLLWWPLGLGLGLLALALALWTERYLRRARNQQS